MTIRTNTHLQKRSTAYGICYAVRLIVKKTYWYTQERKILPEYQLEYSVGSLKQKTKSFLLLRNQNRYSFRFVIAPIYTDYAKQLNKIYNKIKLADLQREIDENFDLYDNT